MNKAVDFRDPRLLVFQLCKGRKKVIFDQCHSQIRLQNKIKGNQRLGTNRRRISQRFKSLFYGLMARSSSVFNGTFWNSSLKKMTVKKFKPKWWREEMEPVNCTLRADRNLGAAGFLERRLHFKEGRNFMGTCQMTNKFYMNNITRVSNIKTTSQDSIQQIKGNVQSFSSHVWHPTSLVEERNCW